MGVKERKIKEKEKRKATILKSAKKIFLKVGFQNSSMDMIALESQLSKGTLYLYFKSKDDLYVSVLLDGISILEEMLKKTDNKDISVEERMIEDSLSYYHFACKHPEYFNIMFDLNTGDMLKLDNVSEKTLERIKSYEQRIFINKMKLIQNGIAEGKFHDEVSACYTTMMVWTMLTGAIMLSRNGKSTILESIHTEEFIKDITKTVILANSKDPDLAKKFRHEIYQNALNLAPHKYTLKEINENNNN